MSALTWRELPPSTPNDHATVQARFRELVRDRQAHPRVERRGGAS